MRDANTLLSEIQNAIGRLYLSDLHLGCRLLMEQSKGIILAIPAKRYPLQDWLDAVKQMQMAGILMGKSGNRFDPTATATRAEVSAMLRRYVELVVNTETAEGWAMNESGQWLYIENGKRVTGNKTIGGKSYTFDQYGVTTALPPERKYLAYTVQAGDSFWAIARKYKVSMFELAKVNGKTIFSVIQPGEILQIPEK